MGSISDALNPKQFTLYNQLHGANLGTGILPSGTAGAKKLPKHNSKPRRLMAMHSPTDARSRSTVAEPGTRPYSIISGATDAAVAMNLDPMSNLLKARIGSHRRQPRFCSTH